MCLHVVQLSMLLLQTQHVFTCSLAVYAVVTDNMWLHVVQLSMLLLQTQHVVTCSSAVYAVVTDTTCGYM